MLSSREDLHFERDVANGSAVGTSFYVAGCCFKCERLFYLVKLWRKNVHLKNPSSRYKYLLYNKRLRNYNLRFKNVS